MNYVYRYIDLADNIIKYVGIVCRVSEGGLEQRVKEHFQNDAWSHGIKWRVEYIEVPTKNDAHALETHFITLYDTGKWFNHAKKSSGLLSFVSKDAVFDWKVFANGIYQERHDIAKTKRVDGFIGINVFPFRLAEALADTIDCIKIIDDMLEREDYSRYPRERLLEDRDELISHREEFIKVQLSVPLHLI